MKGIEFNLKRNLRLLPIGNSRATNIDDFHFRLIELLVPTLNQTLNPPKQPGAFV